MQCMSNSALCIGLERSPSFHALHLGRMLYLRFGVGWVICFLFLPYQMAKPTGSSAVCASGFILTKKDTCHNNCGNNLLTAESTCFSFFCFKACNHKTRTCQLKKCYRKTRTKEKEDNAFTHEVGMYGSSWRTKVEHSIEVVSLKNIGSCDLRNNTGI